METSNDEDLSFDIIKCLPEDICDNIFGNLKSRDLLEASLVSTEWNKFIGKSAVCMQKLKLKFLPKNLKETRLVKRVLKNSGRKYENVEFQEMELKDMRSILLILERKWKKVTLRYLDFPTEGDFINLIAIIEPFVEELTMNEIRIRSDYYKKLKPFEQQTKSLTFPNLKFLEENMCTDSVIEVFQDVVTLTEFNTRYTEVNVIQKMFRSNKGLKKLTLGYSAFNDTICEKISSSITYRLISLQINGHYSPTLVLYKANIKQFLELHMKTLESLSLGWIGLETLNLIFHMPRLKYLGLTQGLNYFIDDDDELCFGDTLNWKETNFQQSLSLTSFDLIDSEVNIEIIRALITATPNVKKLELHSINDESIACISEMLPNLESLSVATFIEKSDVTDKSSLPKVKELKLVSISDENIACISKLLPNLESFSVNYFGVSDVTDKSFFPKLKEFSMKNYFLPIKQSEAEEDRSQFESLFLAEKKTAIEAIRIKYEGTC